MIISMMTCSATFAHVSHTMQRNIRHYHECNCDINRDSSANGRPPVDSPNNLSEKNVRNSYNKIPAKQ